MDKLRNCGEAHYELFLLAVPEALRARAPSAATYVPVCVFRAPEPSGPALPDRTTWGSLGPSVDADVEQF